MLKILTTLVKTIPKSKILKGVIKNLTNFGPLVAEGIFTSNSLKEKIHQLEKINKQQYETIQDLTNQINVLSHRIVLIFIVMGSITLISIISLIVILVIK